jgi:hypothetical protein
MFMAAGGGILSRQNIAFSTNLTDWTISSSRTARPLRAIAYGNSQFRVVGNEGDGATTYSGLSWTSGGLATEFDLLGTTFGNGAFLDVGQQGYLNFGQLPIGQPSGTTNDLQGVVFANGRFVAVGAGGTIITSTDGVNWSNRVSGIGTLLRAVTFGDGVFVAVGEGGRILTSADAVTWNVRSSGPIDTLHDLAEGDGRLLAVGEAGAVFGSTNGTDWAGTYMPTAIALSRVCFGRGIFVALSSSEGVICTSADGANWKNVSFGSQTNLNGIVCGSNRFVVVGQSYDSQSGSYFGVGLSSTNGETWIPADVGTNWGLNAVAYGNDVFVAVGEQSGSEGRLILSSMDAVSWIVRYHSAAPILRALVYGNSRFVAAGEGRILTSADGASWQEADTGTSDLVLSLAYGNGLFLASGYGTPLSSPDGIHWTPQASPVLSYPAGSVTFARETFFLVGAQGAIFQTDPIVTLALNFGTMPQLSLFGPTGRWHDVQATENPGIMDSWQTAGSIFLTNSPQLWTDTRLPHTRQFYRSMLIP